MQTLQRICARIVLNGNPSNNIRARIGAIAPCDACDTTFYRAHLVNTVSYDMQLNAVSRDAIVCATCISTCHFCHRVVDSRPHVTTQRGDVIHTMCYLHAIGGLPLQYYIDAGSTIGQILRLEFPNGKGGTLFYSREDTDTHVIKLCCFPRTILMSEYRITLSRFTTSGVVTSREELFYLATTYFHNTDEMFSAAPSLSLLANV